MRDRLCFVIFGAASDVIKPVYSAYSGCEFLLLVNQSIPAYMPGDIISTSEPNFLNLFVAKLEALPADNTIVFINAAVVTDDQLFISHSQSAIDKMLHVGIKLLVDITKVIVSEMVARKKGRLINLSSFRATTPSAGTVLYSSMKGFSEALFRGLGLEYGRFDITSNSIALGFMDTKLLGALPEKKKQKYKKAVSKREFVPESEFLSTLDYIISSSYLNSTVVDLDGGLARLD